MNDTSTLAKPGVRKRELIAWAFYDFANSGYTTVVLTTIYSAFFVGVIASELDAQSPGQATFLWSLAIGIANLITMILGPVIGAIADHQACKKLILLISSIGCISSTLLLAFAGSDAVWFAFAIVIFSAMMFSMGENLIASFLPELVNKDSMGKMSGYGWSVGYFGGLLTLGGCLALIHWGRAQGMADTTLIPYTLILTALIFALTSLPTFLWLKERAEPVRSDKDLSYILISFQRLGETFKRATHFRDLFNFLLALAVYQSGVSTVIVLAAIYAQEVMGFAQEQLIILIMVVNVTAAIGAFACGHLQDKIGSIPTLSITLLFWVLAIFTAYIGNETYHMWLAGNLIGLAMGASQSVGRALVSKFTPDNRSAEFLGLWGVVTRLSAILGPLSYGFVNYLTEGDHRASLLSTLLFFLLGLVLILRVNETRGKQAAHH